MSIWNKILLWLIFLASLVFFYYGARALKVQTVWRNNIRKHEEVLQKLNEQIARVQGAKDAVQSAEMNLRKARIELHRLQFRGRVWGLAVPEVAKDAACDVTRQQVDLVKDEKSKQDTVRVAINVPWPTPHQITPSMVCYLFDKADVEQGGKYLGEFTVVAVADKQVQLQPSKKFTEAQIATLRASQGPWVLYDTLLTDDHDVFQDYEGLDKLLKPASLPEYQQDGKPLDPNNKESAKYERKLRDYLVLFQEYHHQYSLWVEAMEAIKRDQQLLKAAQEMATEQVDLRVKEIVKIEAEKTDEIRKRDAVATHRKAVDAKLAGIEGDNRKLENSNRAMVAEIARIQWEATRRIDAQTRKMAQAEK
jgi:hypothetical protein